MAKLLLKIQSNKPELTIETINKYLSENNLTEIGIDTFNWDDRSKDLPRGERKYYFSNRLSKNKITMDDTKYTNPELTRFECCICLKVKAVEELLVDYLRRCKQCKHS